MSFSVPASLSLSVSYIQTQKSLCSSSKEGGLAIKDASLHRRTAETTDGHSSEGLLPHIRLSSTDPLFLTLHIPPSAFSPDPPLSPPRCGLQQTVIPNPHLSHQSAPSSSLRCLLFCTVTFLLSPFWLVIPRKRASHVLLHYTLSPISPPSSSPNSGQPLNHLPLLGSLTPIFHPLHSVATPALCHQKPFLHWLLLLLALTSITINFPAFLFLSLSVIPLDYKLFIILFHFFFSLCLPMHSSPSQKNSINRYFYYSVL